MKEITRNYSANKKRFDRLAAQVSKVAHGQLLQLTGQRNVVASVTQTDTFEIPIGRGNVVGFSLHYSFLTVAASFLGSYDIFINGKAICRNNQYAQCTTSRGGSSGTHIMMIDIPEGATVDVVSSSGAFAGLGALAMDFLFTEPMLPVRGNYDYRELFNNEFPVGAETSVDFRLPAERGDIVGLELFTRNILGNLENDLTTRATLSVNGVNLIEDFNPRRYLPIQEVLGINGWVVNIKGGATMNLRYNNNQLVVIDIGVYVYFKQGIGKKQRKLDLGKPTKPAQLR